MQLMYRFESLGENCEFGLVQRKLGAEPAGLLGFASAPIDRLIPALQAGFDGMGAPGQIEIERAAKEYMGFDKRFGFRYHAWVMLGDKEPAEIIRGELVRVPVLIEKRKEDLALGQKIFVYLGMGPLAARRVEALDQAMRPYGANTLFWVDTATADHPAGTVESTGPHLLKGYIDRFAPGENGYDFSLPVWLQICERALEM